MKILPLLASKSLKQEYTMRDWQDIIHDNKGNKVELTCSGEVHLLNEITIIQRYINMA